MKGEVVLKGRASRGCDMSPIQGSASESKAKWKDPSETLTRTQEDVLTGKYWPLWRQQQWSTGMQSAHAWKNPSSHLQPSVQGVGSCTS